MDRTSLKSARPGATRRRTTRRRTALGLLTAAVLVAAGVALPLGAAVAATGPPPLEPLRSSADAEGFTAYVPQNSCDPVEKPGVRMFRLRMMAFYQAGRHGGSARHCNYGIVGEHKDGRAWDWMLDRRDPAERAVADRVLAWLLAPGTDGRPAYMARRLGIMYMAHNVKIWGSYRWREGWRRANPNDPHTDHIHFSFSWEGAMGRTSYWTGRAAGIDHGTCVAHSGDPAVLYQVSGPRASACSSPRAPRYRTTRPRIFFGSTGSHVTHAQRLLGISPTTGTFGHVTRNATIAFQQRKRLPVTGAVDVTTWGVLDPSTVVGGTTTTPPPPPSSPTPVVLRPGARGAAVVAVQTKLGMPRQYRTGYYGPITTGYVRDFQATTRRPVTGVVDRATYAALTPRTATALTVGSRGSAVTLLQTRLGMPTTLRTGYFGTLTRSAVRTFQTRHRLLVTGVAYAYTRAWLRM